MLLYLKLALLVSILLASRINLISAKQFHFKMCWTRGQFGDILDRNCPSLYGLKRSIETNGKLQTLLYQLDWIGPAQDSDRKVVHYKIRVRREKSQRAINLMMNQPADQERPFHA